MPNYPIELMMLHFCTSLTTNPIPTHISSFTISPQQESSNFSKERIDWLSNWIHIDGTCALTWEFALLTDCHGKIDFHLNFCSPPSTYCCSQPAGLIYCDQETETEYSNPVYGLLFTDMVTICTHAWAEKGREREIHLHNLRLRVGCAVWQLVMCASCNEWYVGITPYKYPLKLFWG